MMLTFRAWQEQHYISAAELLLTIGRPLCNLRWRVRIEEVAPAPGAVELEDVGPNKELTTFELLHLVTPDIQIIDGELEGRDQNSDSVVVCLRAVDSTSWDVESDVAAIMEPVRTTFEASSIR
jgi:hypothetical protein